MEQTKALRRFCMIFIFLFCLDTASSAGFLFSPVHFPNVTKQVRISDTRVHKPDGLAASRIHPDILYTENGSTHGTATLYALDATSGQVRGVLHIDGADHKVWSDIAIGPCETHGFCIYIGDIGSDKGHPQANVIYRVREPPSVDGEQHVQLDGVLKFSYGESNAGTLLVDPQGEVYVVSEVKIGNAAFIHLPSPAWGSTQPVHVSPASHLAFTSPEKDPVSGDISPDGSELLIKARENVLYWAVPDGNYARAVAKQPIKLPYMYVDQEEAICWNKDSTGYYTLSEYSNSNLNFYSRSSSR